MKTVTFIPSNKEHSIEEFSIAFFFTKPISNFDTFSSKVISVLKDEFNDSNIINDEIISDGENSNKSIGFQLLKKNNNSSEEKQKVEEALVCIDYIPQIKQKTKISYHNLHYTNWEEVREKIKKNFSLLSKEDSDLEIEAFNLTYVDTFHWNMKIFPQLDSFFKTDSPRIPMEILTSNKPCAFSLTISTEEFLEKKEEKDTYVRVLFDDILKVSIAQHKTKEKYRILIKHSMVHVLKESKGLKTFFEDEYNFRLIDLAQTSNKKLLRKLLKPRIQELINLNKVKI